MLVWNKFINSLYENIIILGGKGVRRAGDQPEKQTYFTKSVDCHRHRTYHSH